MRELAKEAKGRIVDPSRRTVNLIPVLTALGNVELLLRLTSLTPAERRNHAEQTLRIVGLEERIGHLLSELSGGQQQRVAVAGLW